MKFVLVILFGVFLLSCNNKAVKCDLACGENTHYADETECECVCNDGYILSPNEFDCIKENVDLCIDKQCQANATCDSDTGECACNKDYVLSPNGADCIKENIDLCIDKQCQANATCDSDTGECVCNEGYTISDNNKECIKNIENSWYKPNSKTTWHWQLTGEINTTYDVDLYDIDLFDNSKELIKLLHDDGKIVICYFSAGSYENWRPDKDLFTADDYEKKLDGWDGERWLDIRRENVKNIMKKRLDLAVEKKCDGVEPDNMDGYSNNTGLDLTYEDQIEYNTFLSTEAHKRNLSVALKNDLEQVNDLVEIFDFSLNEQCHQYNECDMLKPFTDADKPIFNAEYDSIYKYDKRNELCDESQSQNIRTLILPMDLDDEFSISCDVINE